MRYNSSEEKHVLHNNWQELVCLFHRRILEVAVPRNWVAFNSFMQRLSSTWRHFAANRQTLTPLRISWSRQLHYSDILFRTADAAAGLQRTPLSLPTSMTQSAESFGNYDLIKRVKLDFTDVAISKWRSRVTGLTVIHLDYEGKVYEWLDRHYNLTAIFSAPIVNGYFVVGTESERICW